MWFGQLANYFMTVFIGNWIEHFRLVQWKKYNTNVPVNISTYTWDLFTTLESPFSIKLIYSGMVTHWSQKPVLNCNSFRWSWHWKFEKEQVAASFLMRNLQFTLCRLGRVDSPKRTQKDPKGPKRNPKGPKRNPKGPKRNPKGDRNGSKRTLSITI